MNVVWFKRDLRIHDHEALTKASENGDILPLYIIEPGLWLQEDMSYRQYQFLVDALVELNSSLEKLGQGLIIKVGEAIDILKAIHKKFTISKLWSHQETWNGWTYKRDKLVKKWAKASGIIWNEPSQNGVVRCLKTRDGWSNNWYKQMNQNLFNPPQSINKVIEPSDDIPSPEEMGLENDYCNVRQNGGRMLGQKLLKSFLFDRGENYTKEMSSPVTAFESCSRLSAHLAFGTLSIREVFQAADQKRNTLKEMSKNTRGKWPSAMSSFLGRLRWHCHFIQKLEDQPSIEFKNMHSGYDGLRENNFNDEYFQAWKRGMTGYPMVDACMRALRATGWINFRMRAMLVSFASYNLWLHWRKTSIYLAQLFTDYEPGIHYSQIQMQSGTTGINSIRIYNPIKQSVDHDPEGKFIREWVPELRHISNQFIHTPWKLDSEMNGYPMPIVDEIISRKKAASKVFALKKNNVNKQISSKVVKKHGSRKSHFSQKSSKGIKERPVQIQGEFPI